MTYGVSCILWIKCNDYFNNLKLSDNYDNQINFQAINIWINESMTSNIKFVDTTLVV